MNTGTRLQLSADQISFFQQNGFLSIPQITTSDEVDRIRTIYDGLFTNKTGREEGNQFDLAGTDEEGEQAKLPQIMMPSKYAPELAESQLRRNAMEIARQLLGPEAEFHGDHAIFKPAQYGAETPWHQDEAYWDPELEYDEVSIWIPFQEATPENGCMYFIPGSHRMEILPHRPINNDPRIHGLEVERIDDSTAVACPLPAGGATIHHCRTLHYTPANRSDIPRRAYIIGIGKPYKKQAKQRRFPWQEARKTAREQRAQQTGGNNE